MPLSYSYLKQLPCDFRGAFFHIMWRYPVPEVGARMSLQVRKTAKPVQRICFFRVSFIDYWEMERAFNSYADTTPNNSSPERHMNPVEIWATSRPERGKGRQASVLRHLRGKKRNIDAASRKCHNLPPSSPCMPEGLKALYSTSVLMPAPQDDCGETDQTLWVGTGGSLHPQLSSLCGKMGIWKSIDIAYLSSAPRTGWLII